MFFSVTVNEAQGLGPDVASSQNMLYWDASYSTYFSVNCQVLLLLLCNHLCSSDINQSNTWLYFATMEEGKILSKTGLESERLNETWSVMFLSSQVKSCLARVTVGWSTTTEAWSNSTTQWETTRRCLNTTTYCPTGTGWGTGSLQWRMPWRTSTLHPSRPRRWYKLSYWPRA